MVAQLVRLYNVSKCHQIVLNGLLFIMGKKKPGMEPDVQHHED